MRNLAYIISLIVSCFYLSSPGQWSVVAVDSLNTTFDEIVCGKYGKGVLFSRADKEDYLSNLDWTNNKHYQLYSGTWLDKFTEFVEVKKLLSKNGGLDDGTAHYSRGDSTLWFSTANILRKEKGNQLRIYSCKESGGEWAEFIPFSWNSHQYSVAHPALSPSGDQLFFSSDMTGGAGAMDIWYCNLLDDGWSVPIWMGPAVNSSFNEIFPSYYAGEVYYATDKSGSLDLWKATKQSQWKKAHPLEHFNSASDDFGIVFIDQEHGYLSSNRGGNDDIYHFSKDPDESDLLNYTAILMCKGTPIPNAKITVRNESDMIAFQSYTSKDGKFPLDNLNLYKKYSFKIEGVDPEILSQSLLYVLDSNGNRIRVYHIGRDGTFIFQALPSDDVDKMTLRDDTDGSILTLDIEGQIYEEEPGDMQAGEAVYILNEKNELLALAFTSSEGQFIFSEISPQMGYTFKVTQGSNALHLTIYEGDSKLTVPIENRVASYRRLKDEQTIRLINENREPIYIQDDEVFIIRNIYYLFDSVNINVIAKQQLEQLGEIMRLNPQIHIELSSHTDSRGEDDYNLSLSERRANGAVRHLQQKGIEEDRMSPRGFGETRLLNNCTNDNECPEEMHALNRRTEIRMFVK